MINCGVDLFCLANTLKFTLLNRKVATEYNAPEHKSTTERNPNVCELTSRGLDDCLQKLTENKRKIQTQHVSRLEIWVK